MLWRNSGKPRQENHVTRPNISGIAPFFIVKNVPAALSFYRDRLGFEITFQGPPEGVFFGIVQRGAAMIMVKDVGVDPLPNWKREPGWARWDAYLSVPDPDALAEEFSSRNVEFSEPLKDTDDGLRGFELKDADGYVLFFWLSSSMSTTPTKMPEDQERSLTIRSMVARVLPRLESGGGHVN
jgi:catechol 2,3-dioxygenase-like lactoylglutathione lyase family enzyme